MTAPTEGEIHVNGPVQPFQMEQFAGCVAYGMAFQDAAAHSGITGSVSELSSFAMRQEVQLRVAIKLKERLGGDMDAIEAIVTARLWELHLMAVGNGDTGAAIKCLDQWQKKQAVLLSKIPKTATATTNGPSTPGNPSADTAPANTRATIRDLWEELRKRAKATGDTTTEATAIANLDKIDGVSAEASANANMSALSSMAQSATAITFTLTRPHEAIDVTPSPQDSIEASEQKI